MARTLRISGAKALLDYSVAVVALLLLLPLIALIAVAIMLDSPGPMLHRRRVVGAGGREFDAFKFRTMVRDGDAVLASRADVRAELAAGRKPRDDPRVTRVGAALRRLSLDELPQLLNVLLGHMSLVGPRMLSPEEVGRYGLLGAELLSVKPGLSGPWQVSGRADLPFEERMRLDIEYVRSWNLRQDIQILFKTLPAVLTGRGAY